MKYLKPYTFFDTELTKFTTMYEVSEYSDSRLELDVQDMFLELGDEGFSVDVVVSPQGLDMWILQVTRIKLFNWSDVSDTFERAKDYIESSGRWKLDKCCVVFENDIGENFRLYFDNYEKFIDFVSLDREDIYEISIIFDLVK